MKLILPKKTKYSFIGLLLAFTLTALFSSNVQAQEDGEKLFKSFCASCHSPSAKTLVGPGLAGVYDKYERDWLYKWVSNSQELIKSGDADAVAVYEEFNKVLMPAQPVNNEQIDAILAYVKDYNENAPAEEVATTSVATEGAQEDDSSETMMIVLVSIAVFLMLIAILRKVQHSMGAVIAKNNGEEQEAELSMGEALCAWVGRNKRAVSIMSLIALALVAKAGWDAALEVGIYTDYQPEQPIKFSHKLHAGDNGIDCNYCHNSARFSKSAGVPSANVCMNCHTYIQEGPEYGGEEIAKIYEALDFDPATKTYGDNPKPIKWIKVHNLPDHVYFNHSQHVTVGKIACQKCHGPVEEEFTVGKQHAPLTMGWCIECHRETKVQMDNSGYYDEIHNRLPENLKEQYLEDGTITVSELGGIECAKCHY